jgi:hypothetical protein
VTVAAPQVALARTPDGAADLVVSPPPESHRMILQLRPDKPARLLAVNGVPTELALPTDRWVKLSWVTPGQPVTLTLQPSAAGQLQVRYSATIDGWPTGAAPLPPRPADVMPWDDSDSTFVTGRRALAW